MKLPPKSRSKGPPALKEIQVYNDRSRNFITAGETIDLMLGGLQDGLASALSPGVNYDAYKRVAPAVSVEDYNAVVQAHNRMVREVERLELLVQMREAEIDILRRHARRQ